MSVDKVVTRGRPIGSVRIYLTLRYLRATPVCCGEPGCYVPFLGSERLEVPGAVQRALDLTRPPSVAIAVNLVHDENYEYIEFGRGEDAARLYERSHFCCENLE